ncbi:MAG: Histidyl-tRNA synthetase [Candidatus Roizmanbacteria bacterium GW2011_GWA2_37_7]|uniref:Histidine--tRNA ligase n=1 Tax=Candidatus Roizmanbacteria bacterium GW2011_GWA2_37_7 TaxID=1618481 RepID=A0A0G0HJ83_9BACT|nr:MAG: Histidyl-tRNA synthetase [Candidatus Roizmanbacteria bacterium GW2011_GWA2_37_7]
MTNQNKLQTLKGFRDFLPEEKRKRDFVIKRIVEIFEIFGFEPLETPTLEYATLLMGKYGQEADKLLYSFKDRGGRKIALRYDQTVPTARILTQYQNILPRYFRRYQIQNVFRADNPQKGRYREFTQCDIDIFNSESPIADADIIATSYFAFQNVGYPDIKIQINDRQILFSCLKSFATPRVNIFSLIQSIDKLEKIGKDQVIAEMVKKGLNQNKASAAISNILKAEIIPNLQSIIDMAYDLGVPKQSIIFNPTLARGLDYYTGMIFEVILPGYSVGSCGGGGRYDKLIGQLGGLDVPAVGIAFGFDRMVEAADYFKLIPQTKYNIRALVTVFDKDILPTSLAITSTLRKNRVQTELYPAFDKLSKQLKYADKKGIPFVVIIGPEEAAQNVVKIKNMKTGEEQKGKISDITKLF